MILINLLPHREAARKRRRETYQAAMLGAAMAGLLIAGAIYWWFQMMIENQQANNNFLQSEIRVLEDQIKEIATIEEEIAALRAQHADDGAKQVLLDHLQAWGEDLKTQLL